MGYNMGICMYVCMHACMYVCMYVYVRIYICIYCVYIYTMGYSWNNVMGYMYVYIYNNGIIQWGKNLALTKVGDFMAIYHQL